MPNKRKRDIIKLLLKWLCALILFIIATLISTIYVGVITNNVTDFVTKQISSNSNLDISVGWIDIDFPLQIELHNTLIFDKSVNDTMLATKKLTTTIKPLPLLRQRIKTGNIVADTTSFNLFSEDNSLTLRLRAKQLELPELLVNLEEGIVKSNQINLNGANVNLTLNEVTSTQERDTTSTNWSVIVNSIALNDLDFNMQMLPTIDNLALQIGTGEISSLYLSTETQKLSVESIIADYLTVKYYTPSEKYLASYTPPSPKATTESTDTAAWHVTTDLLQLTHSSALYAQRDYTPKDGFDASYIQAKNITLEINDFQNYGSDISIPIKSLKATERSGLLIRQSSGSFSINSLGMHLTDLNIYTPKSYINLNSDFGGSAFDATATRDNNIKVSLKGEISTTDIITALPEYSDILEIIPSTEPLVTDINIVGDINNLNLTTVELHQQGLYNCSLTGDVKNVMLDNELNAQLQFNGDFINLKFLEDKLSTIQQQSILNLPQFTINGNSNITLSEIDAKVNLETLNGAINASTYINLDTQEYIADLEINSLPVNQIIPSIAIETISSKAIIRGKQFDIFTPSSTLESDIIISKVTYDSIPFDSIYTIINIADGVADISSRSVSNFCDFNLFLTSTILDNSYKYELNSKFNEINLTKLKLSEQELSSKFTISSEGNIELANNLYDVNLTLDSITLKTGGNILYNNEINTYLHSDSLITKASIEASDFLVSFNSNSSLDILSKSLQDSYEVTMRHIADGEFSIDSIHEYLPELTLTVDIAKKSLLERYMETEGVRFNSIDIDLYNDTTFTLVGTIADLYINGILIDSTSIKSNKGDNSLLYSLDLFQTSGKRHTQGSSHISGDITTNKISTLFSKKRYDNNYSLYIGTTATLADSTVTLSFFPENPIIGSEYWSVNDSNYIRYNYTRFNRNKAVRANLLLSEGDSYLKFRTFMDSTNTNNINLAIKGIELGEWLNLSPFSPTISGVLNTQANLTTRNNSIWGDTHLDITELYYNSTRVGTFATNLLLELDPVSKITNAYANLIVNKKKVLKAEGHINDSISGEPLSMALAIDSLPLMIVNPFIPSDFAAISGYLNGDLSILGDMNKPIINGSITGDSLNIHLPTFGSYLKISDSDLAIENNILNFKNFNITGTNNKSLKLNGNVNLNNITSPYIDLQLAGTDIEIINSKQSKNSVLFGKGSITLSTTIKGTSNRLDINTNLSLLSGSDITYVMQTDVSTLTNSTTDDNVVTFTNFNNTDVLRNDSIAHELPFGANINATVNINSGVAFNLYLTPNGYNRLYVTGSGKLDYTQNLLGDSNLTGRYTLSNGFIKYKPPLISMVNFNFTEGSYLSWSGDLMNPNISIKGTESKKTNVAITGEDSRLVEFIIGLNVSNTLNDLDLSLDLSTQDNVTIANQLLAMSAEERATQAMNLLLYNTYTGAETTSSGSSLYTSPVYSFLEGQVNQWAAQNIKAVDLSIGLNNYDQVVDGESKQTTDYSYEISKSLLDNRYKITIGGSYNTNTTDEEEIALNLISNISFDYQLRKDGNTYLKLFRQNGYESVLEGEVSSMGIGYLYKRKLNSLRQLFRLRKKSNSSTNSTTK